MIKIFELNLFRTDFKCDSCGEWFSSVPRYEGKLLNLNLTGLVIFYDVAISHN